MPGAFWLDDLALVIDGGQPVPDPKVVFRETFAKATSVSAPWKKELGARNGDGGEDQSIMIDASVGASADSPKSLKISGSVKTIRWYTLGRTSEAAAGNLFRLRAKVKAADVHRDGIQFANWHLSLAFLDKAGNAVGVPRFESPGDGTYDWQDVDFTATAPLDAASVRVGVFVSMSGTVWVDDLELTVDQGAEPPYGKWLKKETKHLVIRYSPESAKAGRIVEEAKRLDAAYESIRKALAVDFDAKVTMYIYRDNDEAKILIGRDLDFAEPDQRVVHQRANSTPSHELTHCIARAMGYAQTGLLGEGVAVYFNGATPQQHHQAAADLKKEGKLPTVGAMLSDFRGQAAGYPAAGSFCGFVIETYGMDAFKELYTLTDPAAAAERVLGEPLDAVEKKWLASLSAP